MSNLVSVGEQTLRYLKRPHASVPKAPVSGPGRWRGPELRDRPQDWIIELGAEQVAELEAADDRIRDMPPDRITRADFPLPGLALEIGRWRDVLSHGLGLILVRGLPVERWGESRSSRIYWAIGQHLGRPGAQNEKRDLLGHVRDTHESSDDPNIRLYKTSANIAYHCDAADVVGLLCLRPARSGGASRVVSSVAVFNELLSRAPELAERLFEPVLMDARSEGESRGIAHFPVPPCRYAEGVLRTFYHSDYFRSVVRHADVPPLDGKLQELFDTYEEIARSKELCLDMVFEPGDIQWISNHFVLHSRTAYEDDPDPARSRHLLRLWLSFDGES